MGGLVELEGCVGGSDCHGRRHRLLWVLSCNTPLTHEVLNSRPCRRRPLVLTASSTYFVCSMYCLGLSFSPSTLYVILLLPT